MLAKRDFMKRLMACAGSVPFASAFARDGSDAALCYASLAELIAAFKAGRLSPVDLLQAQVVPRRESGADFSAADAVAGITAYVVSIILP